MVTVRERIKSLKSFEPISFGTLNIGEHEYNVTFMFELNCFLFDKNEDGIPPVGVSLSDINIKRNTTALCVNTKDDLPSMMILELIKKFESMSREDKKSFVDSMPINSLYIGGDKLY